jgi:conjugative relaxase-like TrwC/TraI family protein
MISMVIGTSASGAANYHDKAFAVDGYKQEADNYYVNEMAEARWQGKGAELLGIEGGKVTREDFVNALEGKLKNPVTGETQDLSGVKGRRAYYELTMAPPKSVSLAGILGGDDRVRVRHEEANAAAMAWLEEKVTVVRVQQDGVKSERITGNFLYATIQHEVSRANEPQIHNHNVIVAATFDEVSGKWRSLTNDELLNHRKAADQVYKHVLAVGLQKDGYELNFSKDSFEIAGFSKEQLSKFSTRSKVLTDILNERGMTREDAGFMERQKIILDTREAKQEFPREVLMQAWTQKLTELDLDVGKIVDAAKQRSTGLSEGSIQITRVDGTSQANRSELEINDKINGSMNQSVKVGSRENNDLATGSLQLQGNGSLEDGNGVLRLAAMKSVQLAIGHLSEREQAFKRDQLEFEALRFSKGQLVMPSDIKTAVDAHISTKQLLWNDQSKGLLTTPVAVDREEKLMSYVTQGKGAGNIVLASIEQYNEEVRQFNVSMSAKTGAEFVMSREQRVAAKNLLMHPDSFQIVQGEAGTGKTAALAMVKMVAEKRGWEVIGLATAGSAAEELEQSSGISSQTIASFLADQKNREMQLKVELAEIREKQMSQVVSKERLLNVTFGKDNYSIDSKTMDVYRNSRGKSFGMTSLFVGIGHQLGVWSEDMSQKHSRAAREGDLRSRLMNSLGNLGGKVGEYLLDHQKVGSIEAMSIRAAALTEQAKKTLDLEKQVQAVEAKIQNLKNSGTVSGKKMLIVMDEASLTGVNDALKVMRLSVNYGARVVFQGDTQQHSSVPAGQMFSMVQKSGAHISTLKETMRFNKADIETKAAIRLMKSDEYQFAMKKLPLFQGNVVSMTAERYMTLHKEFTEKGLANFSIGVVTATNEDRKKINSSIQGALIKNNVIDSKLVTKEHYDIPKITPAEKSSVAVLMEFEPNRVLFNKTYREIGVEKGQHLEIVGFNAAKNLIYARSEDGKKITFNPVRQDFFTAAKVEMRDYSIGSQVESRAKLLANEAHPLITNGRKGVVTEIKEGGAFIKFDRIDKPVFLSDKELRLIDLGYARTSFKEQGATNNAELIALSEKGAAIFNKEAAYVMVTRAKGRTELITSAPDKVFENAAREVEKTSAINLSVNNPWKVLDSQRRMSEALERGKSRDQGLDSQIKLNQDKRVDQGLGRGV